jgi:GT2 family glycosyltransferase
MNRNNYLVSIIIVNYKDYIFLRNCLASLKSAADKITEIIVVDNESDFSAAEKIKKEFEEIKLYSLTGNLNYAGGNNFGIAHSHGDFIVILNNDTNVGSNWLSSLLDAGLKNYNALYQPKICF